MFKKCDTVCEKYQYEKYYDSFKTISVQLSHFLMIAVHQLITIFTLAKASRDLKSNKLTSSQELL